MGTDLIIPEILLLDKLEEMDNTLSPTVWQQMRNNVVVYDDNDKKLPVETRLKRKMLLSDFVNKAVSLPLEISPDVSPEVERQLYRLHLFCCQQIIHQPEVRHNPLVLGFRALEEMHMALVAVFVTYRLIHPECPYSWSKEFFERCILTHKGPDGHTIVKFKKPIPEDIINAAISEDIVTDWLIYRAYDHAGIRTLRDIKNNLLDIPNFLHGGNPVSEFSRFERKMQEKRNKKQERMNEVLETEFRKTLVKSAAEQAVAQMIESGMSAADLLAQAFNGDLAALTDSLVNNTQNKQKLTPQKNNQNSENNLPKKETKEIDHFIAGLLDDDS